MKTIFVIALLVAFSGYLQMERWRLDDKRENVAGEVHILQEQNAEQMKKNAALKARLDELKEAPDEVFEALAREKLFMVQPGEQYVLPQSEAN